MIVTFKKDEDIAFRHALKERVDAYFTRKGISRYHNPAMLFKTVAMLALYILPFVLILLNLFPFGINLILYLVMGVGVAGVGMSVMHDGNHAGYSANQGVNRMMGLTMNMLGADAYNWKIKHNKLHHVFTNIYGKDEDINSRVILRFAYAAPLKSYHKYQYIYAWFFYALMTLTMIVGDISKRKDYRKRGLTNISHKAFVRSNRWLIFSKTLYVIIILGLPILLTDMRVWQILSGFMLMHLTAGMILAVVFQMAHVVEDAEQPLPDKNGMIPYSLVVHQLRAAADFSKKNKLITWYTGGLNYQVEHHLFPRICHIHYPALSEIVEKTTREFGIPYHVYDGFGEALRAHIRTLKKLGHYYVPAVN